MLNPCGKLSSAIHRDRVAVAWELGSSSIKIVGRVAIAAVLYSFSVINKQENWSVVWLAVDGVKPYQYQALFQLNLYHFSSHGAVGACGATGLSGTSVKMTLTKF